jgi:S1-C subfamily serine protease
VADDRILQRANLKGVLVIDVQPDGAAAKAGLRPTRQNELGQVELGDLITRIDGIEIHSRDDLFRALDQHNAGDQVGVTVQRDGAPVEVRITLQALP